MREIKFRAWNDKTQMMYMSHLKDGSDNPVWSYDEIFRRQHEESTNIMQFTGLHDKNGKEIFENDICVIENSLETISWNQEFCRWDTEQHDGLEEAWDIEVIGNIHEHQHLLQE